MTWLTLRLLVGGGRARTLLVVGCTAVVTTLLLLATTLLLLPTNAEEALYDLVADSGTRYGFVLALVLLVVPPLLLLHQAVRFGTAAREQRLAGLRLAGATPGDVRRLSTLEVGLPALAGGALGVVGFFVLRLSLPGDPSVAAGQRDQACYTEDGRTTCIDYFYGGSLGQIVPQTVTPPWWAFVLVVLGVGVVGGLVGARIGGRLALSPHGVVRRRHARAPRPCGLLVLVVAAVALPFGILAYDWLAGLALMVLLVVALLGVLSLGPWVAHRAGRRVLGRAASAAALLAAGRLVADPRPAGRAASAVGGIGLAAGGATVFLVDVIQDSGAEAYYLVPLGLVACCLLFGLAVTCGTVAVHAVESLTDRRRSVAAQVAQGVPLSTLERSLRWEAGLVAMPLGASGALLGALGYSAIEVSSGSYGVVGPVLTAVAATVVTVLLTLVAVVLTARLLRPAVRAAARPEHLRTA